MTTPEKDPGESRKVDWAVLVAALSLAANVGQWIQNSRQAAALQATTTAQHDIDYPGPLVFRTQFTVANAQIFESASSNKALNFTEYPNPEFLQTDPWIAAKRAALGLRAISQRDKRFTFLTLENASKVAYDHITIVCPDRSSIDVGPALSPNSTLFVYAPSLNAYDGASLNYHVYNDKTAHTTTIAKIVGDPVVIVSAVDSRKLGSLTDLDDRTRRMIQDLEGSATPSL